MGRHNDQDYGPGPRVLLDEPHRHYEAAELALLLGWDPLRVDDTAAELARVGLAHRHDGFTFASEAAASCAALLL